MFACLPLALSAETRLGKPLTLDKPTPIADVLSKADRLAGKTVQVRGRVTEVCEQMGCWMRLADPGGGAMRIKVKDGEIVFPRESIGRIAKAEGRLEKLELTKEQAVARARHEAEEQKRAFDPASVKGPVTIYQLQGTGAVVED